MGAAGCCEARPCGHIRPNLPMSSLKGKADGKISSVCVVDFVWLANGAGFAVIGCCLLMVCLAESPSFALLNAACRSSICCCIDVGGSLCLQLCCFVAALVTSCLVCCCLEWVAVFHMESCCSL